METRTLGEKEYFESRYVTKRTPIDEIDLNNRPSPIIVEKEVIKDAVRILKEKEKIAPSSFIDSQTYDGTDIYLLKGGFVEVNRKYFGKGFEDYLNYLGVLHETEIGLAYIVNKLELPKDGKRIERIKLTTNK